MPNLRWRKHSVLKLADNLVLTLSSGFSDEGDFLCTRVDIREWYNDYPTHRGVVLAKRHLILLKEFIRAFIIQDGPEFIEVEDFKVQRSAYNFITIQKKMKVIKIKPPEIAHLKTLLPGRIYLLGVQQKNNLEKKEIHDLLIDFFLFCSFVAYEVNNGRLVPDQLIGQALDTARIERFKESLPDNYERFKQIYIYPFNLNDISTPRNVDTILRRIEDNQFVSGAVRFAELDRDIFNSLATYLYKVYNCSPDPEATVGGTSTDSCFICISNVIDTVCLPCFHTGCRRCLVQWLRNHDSCAVCRQKVESFAKYKSS